MLSRKEIEEIVEFDRAARFRKQYDRRRYGTSSKRELSFASRHVVAADPYGGMGGDEENERHRGVSVWEKPPMTLEQALGFAANFGGQKTVEKLRSYWDPRDGERVKDGAPTRKTLRYNYIVPDKPYCGKDAAARNRKECEVTVVHVAVRLNRAFVPVVKDVMRFSVKRDVIEMRDMGYHQLGGWICYWDRKDYENKAIRAYIEPAGLGEWSKIDYKWRGAATFPWHETVNVEALKGTRYEWCQYRDGLGIGLCDWLKLYRSEPKVELLAKGGLYDLISPVALKALKDRRVFDWVKARADSLKKKRFSTRDCLWAARHGKELKDARRHFELVETLRRSLIYSMVGKRTTTRFDYERIDKLLGKWHVKPEEYGRYLEECSRAGLDLRNEGTLYPPTKGGRKAFVGRIEALEAENEKREKAERRRRAREDRERARVEKENEKRWIAETMKERGPELEAFQKSIDRTKTLTGCGYKIVLAKTQEELLKEGKRMGNCVGCGTYGRGIVAGDRLIVILNARGKDSAEHRFDVEIDRKSWKVRQCYGPHNSKAPDEVRELAMRIAESLKAKAAEMRRRREASKRRAVKAA